MRSIAAVAAAALLARPARGISCEPISPSSVGTPFIWLRLDEVQASETVCKWPSYQSASGLNGTYGWDSRLNPATTTITCPYMWNTTSDWLTGPSGTYRPVRFERSSGFQVSGFDWTNQRNHTILYAVRTVPGGARQRALAGINNNWLFGWVSFSVPSSWYSPTQGVHATCSAPAEPRTGRRARPSRPVTHLGAPASPHPPLCSTMATPTACSWAPG